MTREQSSTIESRIGPAKTGVPRGEDHFNAVLTELEILEIRALHERGFGCRRIARAAGVSAGHVFRIVQRKAWAHVL